MRTIEVKARIDDFTPLQTTLRDMGARRAGEWEESDTYFKVKRGKYKLKTEDSGTSVLLYYFKDGVKGPKLCVCEQLKLKEKGRMGRFLQANFGQGVEVQKRRTRYTVDGLHVYLDDVRGVGKFVKIEAKVDADNSVHDSRRRVESLVKQFRLTDRELTSYTYDELHRIANLKK
ncbi:MAG: CYTH domain-containing protein [Nitrospirae bacterium]|nr:CYTH domain-containing protein [Nitrospirota bacterium]